MEGVFGRCFVAGESKYMVQFEYNGCCEGQHHAKCRQSVEINEENE